MFIGYKFRLNKSAREIDKETEMWWETMRRKQMNEI